MATNPVERVVRAADRWQQGHRVAGFIFAVFKKFGDDRGSLLVVTLAYYGFLSLFPLLLVLTTILGFLGNQRIEGSVIGSALREFPVYGQQIGRDVVHPLRGSVVGLAIGVLGLLYGSLGVAQAGQHAMAQVWNIPGVVRPGFVPRLIRSLVLFLTMGVAMGLSAVVSGLATVAGHGLAFRLLSLVIEISFNVALYIAVFRVLTPKQIEARCLVLGAAVAGVGYSLLLTAGTALVQHQLRHAQAVYGQYGFVLGLISWLALVATITVYGAELNVVRARHLWPRSIVQPPLTTADRKVLGDIARQEERRPEEQVGVGFQPHSSG